MTLPYGCGAVNENLLLPFEILAATEQLLKKKEQRIFIIYYLFFILYSLILPPLRVRRGKQKFTAHTLSLRKNPEASLRVLVIFVLPAP